MSWAGKNQHNPKFPVALIPKYLIFFLYYLFHHLIALSAVHAQKRAPVLHVRMQHLEDLLRGQLFAHSLVLTFKIHRKTDLSIVKICIIRPVETGGGCMHTYTTRVRYVFHRSSRIRFSGSSLGSLQT